MSGAFGAGRTNPGAGKRRKVVVQQRGRAVVPRSFAFGSPSAAAAAAMAGRGGAAIMDRIRKSSGEKKGVDTPMVGFFLPETTTDNTGIFVINLVAPGNGSWNRVGRKIYNKSVRIKGNFNAQVSEVTGTVGGNVARMVVVWDKQPSGAAIPSFDTVFGKTAQDGTESTTFLDPVKYDNMDRFSVLKDCVMNFTSEIVTNPITGIAVQLQTFDEFIKLGGREVVFLGQTAPMTIADISTGALYVYFRAAAADNDVNDLSIDSLSFARLRYTDL